MFRLPLTHLAFLGCVLAFATSSATGEIIPADNEQSWQPSEFQKLQGRWTTLREEESDQGKSRLQWVELEFAGGELKILILDENKNQTWSNSLRVIGVERVGPVSRLILGSGEQKKAEIYLDFIGDKLTLVGRITPRPFEGFSLSGQYQRPAELKRGRCPDIAFADNAFHRAALTYCARSMAYRVEAWNNGDSWQRQASEPLTYFTCFKTGDELRLHCLKSPFAVKSLTHEAA